jgi:carbamate kinase
MRVVIALGGNALLRRGEAMTAENQRRNIRVAAAALVPIAGDHELIVSHGSGPQIGLLALQSEALKSGEASPLDVLDAEAEGMIGYLIEQELLNTLPAGRECATLLTQIEVDPDDPAFGNPTKPIGAGYGKEEADRLARTRGWTMTRDGARYRRTVASPKPKRIFELGVIARLVEQGVIVVCAGGGGIPVVIRGDGSLIGVEAVIDKDFASALLARGLAADALLMLTDVDAVYRGWGEPDARAIRRVSPRALREFSFAPGSMGPKVEAAIDFVERTGGMAGIGRLEDAAAILDGAAGTTIAQDTPAIVWWDEA